MLFEVFLNRNLHYVASSQTHYYRNVQIKITLKNTKQILDGGVVLLIYLCNVY